MFSASFFIFILYAACEQPGRTATLLHIKVHLIDNGNCFLVGGITRNRYKLGLISSFGVSIKSMQNRGKLYIRVSRKFARSIKCCKRDEENSEEDQTINRGFSG